MAESRTADIVVQLAGCHGAEAVREGVARVSTALGAIGEDLRVTVACSDSASLAGDRVSVIALDSGPVPRFPVIAPPPGDAYRTLLKAGREAGARAIAILGSEPDQITPDMVRALIQPVIVDGFDVVTPGYVHQVFDGLLNAAIVYPLTRALYGRRIQGQIGVDFAFSARVAERWGAAGRDTPNARPTWLLPQAVIDNLRVCQAQLDIRLPPPPADSDLGGLLSQVVGSLFFDLEPRASSWQRVQRSQAVPVFGVESRSASSSDVVDVQPMIDSFTLAYRNLQSVWALVLPPATLVGLKRLTTVEPKRFRMPDDLWARIIFDFALAHRVRTITRDHLLRALVPLYLAWLASYANEMQGRTRAVADVRLEELCVAFEVEKPYLVQRWRWPDRFNP